MEIASASAGKGASSTYVSRSMACATLRHCPASGPVRTATTAPVRAGSPSGRTIRTTLRSGETDSGFPSKCRLYASVRKISGSLFGGIVSSSRMPIASLVLSSTRSPTPLPVMTRNRQVLPLGPTGLARFPRTMTSWV